MQTSKLRETLLKMSQLTSMAIYSIESRKDIERMWLEVEDLVGRKSPTEEDRELLATLSRNHSALARMMIDSEMLHQNLLSQARYKLYEDDTREFSIDSRVKLS